MLGRTDRRRRMLALLLVFAVFSSATALRLGQWQVIEASGLSEAAERSMSPPPAFRLARAEILDRDGKTLAQSISYDRLDAHPKIIRDDRREGIVDTLAEILGLDAQEREAYLEKLATDEPWTWLDRRLTPEQSVEIRLAQDEGKLPGIRLEPQEARFYPGAGGQGGTTLASQLLGFVAADGRGAYGVERLYDGRLTGADLGSMDMASIAGLPGMPDSFDEIEVPPLKLTIDAKLQRQLEKELTTARIANGAKSASAIVMDPHTGAILASATVPGFDANEFARVAKNDMDLLRNPIVSDQYEPGSVMKIFTVTAALDAGAVSPQTRIQDERKLEFYRYTVRNADHGSLGSLAVKDVIARSRNVATAKIAARLAPRNHQLAARRLYALWQKVGMTDRTGVDIAGEAKGSWYDPDEYQWAPVDLANRAFGQGVSVTLLQLATGVSTIVNGGYRVQPHVAAEGELADKPRARVLKPKVARQAQDILVHVTGSVPWYAKGSLIPGYMIGGKTGTAQIWDTKAGQWKDKRFNHSFVGFVGGKRPEAVIAVRIEEPKPKITGQGRIELKIESFELFRMIATAAVKHLDIRKSKDPDAGRPIIGTDAARQLDPVRNREAKQQAKQEARREARREAEGAARDESTRGAAPNAGPDAAAEAAGVGTGAGGGGRDRPAAEAGSA